MIIKADGKVGIDTNNPNGIFEVNNKLLVNEQKIEFKSNLIPYSDDDFNIGNIDKKLSELFLAKDSIWIDDINHIIIENNELKFTKRKTNIVPASILTLGGSEANILTFTNKSYLSNINLTEWLNYGKTLDSNLKLKQIFNNESETKHSVYTWIEDNHNIILNKNNIGIGTINPTVSLDINRTNAIKIPKGTTAERPTYLQKGFIRFNTDLDQFEGYGVGNNWGSLGGVINVNQDTYIRSEKIPGLDNNELEFYTSNNERMIITDDGKIGINVSIPSHQLHIKGNTRIEGDLIVNGVQHIIDTNTSTTEQLRITNDGIGPALILNQLGAQPIVDIQNSNNSVLFIKSGGNIGIKTNEPNISVQVNTTDGIIIPKGTTNERPEHLEQGIIRYNTELEQFEGYGASNNWGSLGGIMDIDNDTYVRAEFSAGMNNDELEFYTYSNERMIIKPDGKIGIGTNNPVKELDINGNLKVSGQIIGNNLDNNYYTKDKLNDNFLSLNYNLNREIYNSDKDINIIAWYRFDNRYKLGKDHSEKLNELTIMNNTDTITSPLTLDDNVKISGKSSILFNSNNQYLKTSKTIDLFDYWDTNNGFSITFWSLITDLSTNIIIFGLDYDNFVIYYDNKLKLRVNGIDLTLQTNIVFNENEWYHHSLVFEKNQYNNTNVFYYIDKFKYILGEDIELLITNNLNSKYTIGYIPNTSIFEGNIFKGYFDDIRFFNKVLDDTNVLNTFNDKYKFIEPYTLQSIGQVEMSSNAVPIFLNDTVSGKVDFLNELDFVSDSVTVIPSQHSVKEYVIASESNLIDILTIKPNDIINEYLAGDITDNKLVERYVKTCNLINIRTNVDRTLQIEHGGLDTQNRDEITTVETIQNNLGLIPNTTIQKYDAKLKSLTEVELISNSSTIPIYEDTSNFKGIRFSNDIEFTNADDNTIACQYSTKHFVNNYVKTQFKIITGIGQEFITEESFNTGFELNEPDYEFELKYNMSIDSLGAEGTNSYNDFTSNVIFELSLNTGISEEDIEIVGIDVGSIILKLKIKSTSDKVNSLAIDEYIEKLRANVSTFINNKTLLLWYQFNNDIGYDSSGNNNHATILESSFNNNIYKRGKGSLALTNTSFKLPVIKFPISTSISFWLYGDWSQTSTENSDNINILNFINLNSYNVVNYRISLQKNLSNDDIYISLKGGSLGLKTIVLNKTINTNTWYYITLLFNTIDGNIQVYVDNILLKNETHLNIITSDIEYTYNTISGNNLNTNKFYGNVDDFRIYNKLLTTTEIANIFNNTEPTSQVGFKNHIEYDAMPMNFINYNNFNNKKTVFRSTNSGVFDLLLESNLDSCVILDFSIPLPDTPYIYTYNIGLGGNTTTYNLNLIEDSLCDILIIAGGGSGGMREGYNGGGGGGAGEVLELKSVLLTRNNYIIKVGKGGTASSSVNSPGEEGQDSGIFTSDNTVIYQCKGGGRGAFGQRHSSYHWPATSGGSGGGGARGSDSIPGESTKYNIEGKGNAGYIGTHSAGGGGGAGSEGITNNGGSGILSFVSGTRTMYASGGIGGWQYGQNYSDVGYGSGGGGAASRTAETGLQPGENGNTGIVVIKVLPKNEYSCNIVLYDPLNTNNIEPSDYSISIFLYDSLNGSDQSQYTINLLTNVICDILIIAGGGAGGRERWGRNARGGGGGGAGGLIYLQDYYLASGNYVIKVGNGGTKTSISGNNGKNSSFHNLTAIGGGGGGGGSSDVHGKSGGSGGGGGDAAVGALSSGGNSTANQGFNGAGTKPQANGVSRGGGGGGGSSSAGTSVYDGTKYVSSYGFGGKGTNINITNENITYAKGGNGSPTSSYVNETNAEPNTGDGGNAANKRMGWKRWFRYSSF